MNKTYFKIDSPNSIDTAIIEVIEKYRVGDKEFFQYTDKRRTEKGLMSIEQELDILLDDLIENQSIRTAKITFESISFFLVITIAYVLPNGSLKLLQDEFCFVNYNCLG